MFGLGLMGVLLVIVDGWCGCCTASDGCFGMVLGVVLYGILDLFCLDVGAACFVVVFGG